MKPDKILFVDTETGGLDSNKNSLLSMAFVVWQEFEIIGTKEILINDGVLDVTEVALKINGINIESHKKNAKPPLEAISDLEDFLAKYFRPDEKITLGGHNINFDVNFIRHFLNQNNYNFSKRFSHRYVDTATILYFLYLSGKLKQKALSSQEAFDIFGISVDNRHTALGDAIATAELFTKLLRTIFRDVKIKKSDIAKMPSLFEQEL